MGLDILNTPIATPAKGNGIARDDEPIKLEKEADKQVENEAENVKIQQVAKQLSLIKGEVC